MANTALPPGFKIEMLARLVNPREMALGSEGTLFAASARAGNVYAITLRPGAPARVSALASGLRIPIGVAFRGGALRGSATDRSLRFDDIEHRLDAPPDELDHAPKAGTGEQAWGPPG